jgi:Cytochrome C oxidase, cbb3-type, subunit III
MKLLVLIVLLAWMAGVTSVRLDAQGNPPTGPGRSQPLPDHRTGEDVYRAACLTCHGADGTGSPKAVIGFDVAPPDFTDCAFATAEPDPDWEAVVHEGGPIRALDRHMPAFGDALSSEDIKLAVGHLRTFCKEPAWPRGDLNLPRALFTEKAFPENESLWVTRFRTRDENFVENDLIYERRFGARSQIEIVVPIDFQQVSGGSWSRGLGDVALAFKRTIFADVDTGGIGAAGLEVIAPTGKESIGLGNGYWVFEPFAAWGQILPKNAFLQVHGGAELPSDTTLGAKEAFLRTSIGATLAQDRGFGRAWSPQVEVLWARPEGGSSEWDVVPQVQVTLSKLQHVMVAGGVRIPVTERQDRSPEAVLYLLWDWFDGGFFDFWK